MFPRIALLAVGLLLNSFSHVSALGTSCSVPLGAGTAAAADPYWLQNIKHQGLAAFNANPAGYQIFRNVKDFGAIGDGVADDTLAINAAIAAGGRCGQGCASSTVTPAVIFFPKGTYLVSAPIIPFYYTQLIGDAKTPPTLLAAANFSGFAVIDSDPPNWWTSVNVFFRAVKNFVIDTRRMPVGTTATGIHWQVGQATTLVNIVFQLSAAAGTAHQGIWMEDGRQVARFMGDLVFNGGKFGLWGGNQQFTVRNATMNNVQTAFFSTWNWGWTFQSIFINNCQVGFDVLTGGVTQSTQSVGSHVIVDAVVSNTPIFIRTSTASNGKLGGSLVINNAQLTNVPVAVGVVGGATVLAGGTTTIASWAQGNVYTGTNATGKYTQGTIPTPNKPSVLLDSAGRFASKTQPQYANYALSQIVSVKDNGAKGDGKTDDTAALKAIFAQYAGCKIIFFDAGTYIVSSTLTIPAGVQIIGEAFTTIAGKGAAFQDINNPQVVVKVGDTNSQGLVEITGVTFTTIGSAPGAIVVEWNVKQPTGQLAGAGMWDCHVRLGGATGSNLEIAQCPSGSNNGVACAAAFLALHLTTGSTAYLEGTWLWLGDHDLDGDGRSQLTIFSGRGLLSESQGPVWLIGTASEHHVMYQYSLVNAKNHYIGLMQTETPYYQPVPAAPAPFTINAAFNDPSLTGMTSALALSVKSSTDILIFGAGFYSFFINYSQDCVAAGTCQSQIVNLDTTSSVHIYGLSTVATVNQISVNNVGIIKATSNIDGFASTVTSWSQT